MVKVYHVLHWVQPCLVYSCIQAFEEDSDGVQLLSDVTLSDVDHQEIFNLTQAEVHSLSHTHTVYHPPTDMFIFIPIMKIFMISNEYCDMYG